MSNKLTTVFALSHIKCGCLLVVASVILNSQGLLCLRFDFESGNKGINCLGTSHSEHMSVALFGNRENSQQRSDDSEFGEGQSVP